MNLVFLGPPGVGKGTHAEEAGKYFNIPHISTGDLLREEVKNNTELGLKAKEYMERGELVPLDLVMKVLNQRLKQDDCKKGFILDGFPRNMEQVKELEKICKVDLVLNFVASEKTIIDRISNRLTCKKCGSIYNILFVKPKKNGICDTCGGELYQREDQKPEVIKNRLEVYEKETKPLIDYYKKKGLLIDFNAEGTKEEVEKRMIEILNNHFKK